MKITEEQYKKIEICFLKRRKGAGISNLQVLNAIRYVMENRCKWRALPEKYGNWHTIYIGMNRWVKKGILQKAFQKLQEIGIIKIQVNITSLDSTSINVHSDGMGALKKAEHNQLANLMEAGT